LPLGVEFQDLLKCFGRGGQLALSEQQLAARLVCAIKLWEDGQCTLDSRIRLIEAFELKQRKSRQAQEVGILGVLVKRAGADGFRGFGLASLQKRLCLLKPLLLFYFMGNRSSPTLCRAYVIVL